MSSPDRDIFTEPEMDPVTLRHLGPLAALAGVWEGAGLDTHPVREGSADDAYLERMELQPIDPQPNGPQLLYGLRYHLHIRKPGEAVTFHDQVGYWLWEPATNTVMQSLTIPRGQVALAGGRAEPDARRFTVRAELGSRTFGICSGPFLDEAFRTLAYTATLAVNDDGTLTYELDTVLQVAGRAEPFHHTDRNTLRKVAEPSPNPAARVAAEG
ncbi:FABP family protein [Anaeromyxobacter diazotrophicus]|uniref:FABP family protein n=1 Tax=Anaeromyxobacter diazotrophicus TaxID=2590199 RepID=A0A7I9VRD0_9BACT|nr:heme-binding beta-barrel domain-containing protein [Anaeromyxobacter diazotrophicus]GEJ58798.1 FABP family protein [Anaeromyxobacter diazotrophicus]